MGCCSPSVAFITLLLWTGTGLYVGGGIAGLSGTLDLFAEYGPVKERGNPTLDEPPEMWTDPKTGRWELKDPNIPGSRVPQAFETVKHVLIGWAVFMVISSVIFITVSIRTREVIRNSASVEAKTTDSTLCCATWLTGYSLLVMTAWLIQAGFAVVPLLQYRIAVQRCWDLNNSDFAVTTKRAVCMDLVQYGLVQFRETDDDGFALVCGPGGNYDPRRGDLEGFCDAYYPTFTSFVLCFTGACIGLISVVLFALEHCANSTYLKAFRYYSGESRHYLGPGPGPNSIAPKQSQRLDDMPPPGPPRRDNSIYRVPTPRSGSLVNRNFRISASDSRSPQPKVPDVISFRKYRPEEEEDEIHTVVPDPPKYRHLDSNSPSSDDDRSSSVTSPSSADSDDLIPKLSRPHLVDQPPRSRGSAHNLRVSTVSDRRRPPSQMSGSRDGRGSRLDSVDGRSRRSQRTLTQKPIPKRDESPSSDYYMNEDKQRRSSTRWG